MTQWRRVVKIHSASNTSGSMTTCSSVCCAVLAGAFQPASAELLLLTRAELGSVSLLPRCHHLPPATITDRQTHTCTTHTCTCAHTFIYFITRLKAPTPHPRLLTHPVPSSATCLDSLHIICELSHFHLEPFQPLRHCLILPVHQQLRETHQQQHVNNTEPIVNKTNTTCTNNNTNTQQQQQQNQQRAEGTFS